MEAAMNTGILFGIFTVGGTLIVMAATYSKCSKYNFTDALKRGAIISSFPSIAYFLASLFEVVRNPFVHFFEGFGIEPEIALKLGLGYLLMLFIWPGTVWAILSSDTAACVVSEDEAADFKTKLLAQLKAKQHQEAKATAPPKTS